MKVQESLALDCNLTVEVRDAKTGNLLGRRRVHNLVLDAGLNLLRDLINGTVTSGNVTHVAVGTGTTPPAGTDTALVAEVFRDVVTARTVSPKAVNFQLVLASTQANGHNLTEAGLIVAGLVPEVLFARAIFEAVPKDETVTVTLSWDVTFAAGGV